MVLLEPYGATDAGKVRKNNEDSLLVGEGRDETLFAVADGIGGFEAGEVASSIAVDALKELGPEEPFEAAIREANRRILAAGRGDEKLSGMGTTVVAVRFGRSGEEPVAEVAHVGDSRAYLLRGGELRPLTEDHSLVAELVRSGDLTRAQAAEHPQKNLITRALGAEEDVNVDTMVLPVEVGDRLLLCSDGLTDMVPEARLSEILSASARDPEGAVRSLVGAALDAGGADNVTVVVVDVKRQPHGDARQHSGTREMQAVAPPGGSARARATHRGRGASLSRLSKRPAVHKGRTSLRSRVLAKLVRGLAVLLVLGAALTPAYLWGASRYFFDFDDGEVVAYRGLPYAPLGVDLNEEWQRSGVEETEVRQPYRQPIEDHKLYTRDQAEQVLQDIGE